MSLYFSTSVPTVTYQLRTYVTTTSMCELRRYKSNGNNVITWEYKFDSDLYFSIYYD